MKIAFREAKLSKESLRKLHIINEIIETYQEEGYKLTLRQLYYQLVKENIIANVKSEYAKLSTLLKEGRMGGLVDWDAIEDRVRVPKSPSSFDSAADIVDAAIKQFALPRQKGQKIYLEVWVEKDALSGILSRVTEKYHVPIMVNRGYSSASAMFDAHERFVDAIIRKQSVKIIYLGDYDPSGIDMIRDITDRISEFLINSEEIAKLYGSRVPVMEREHEANIILEKLNTQGYKFKSTDKQEQYLVAYKVARYYWIKRFVETSFSVTPIALNLEQITRLKLPPNPAKISDPRAKDFMVNMGNYSWEIDALSTKELNSLLEEAIQSNIDIDLFNEMVRKEDEQKNKLINIKKATKW